MNKFYVTIAGYEGMTSEDWKDLISHKEYEYDPNSDKPIHGDFYFVFNNLDDAQAYADYLADEVIDGDDCYSIFDGKEVVSEGGMTW